MSADLDQRTLTWLRPGPTGLLKLTSGTRIADLSATLGKVSEAHLPASHLRLFEHFPDAKTSGEATVECVFDRERLSEVRVNLHVFDAGHRQSLVDALSGAFDALGERTSERHWEADGCSFALTASPVDVLEEGMPIVVTVSATWTLADAVPQPAEQPSAERAVRQLDWGFVFVDGTPAGAQLGETFDEYAARMDCPSGQRRKGEGRLDCLVTEVEADDDDQVLLVRVSLEGESDGFDATVDEWKCVLEKHLGAPRPDGTYAFAWGDHAAMATLEPTDFGDGEWSVEVSFEGCP